MGRKKLDRMVKAFSLSRETVTMLEELSEKQAKTMSAVIDTLVEQEYRRQTDDELKG